RRSEHQAERQRPHPRRRTVAAATMIQLPETRLTIKAVLAVATSASKAAPMDLSEKVKELVRLAQEQGYLTYNDINDALPDGVISPDELDDLYGKLRNL